MHAIMSAVDRALDSSLKLRCMQLKLLPLAAGQGGFREGAEGHGRHGEHAGALKSAGREQQKVCRPGAPSSAGLGKVARDQISFAMIACTASLHGPEVAT